MFQSIWSGGCLQPSEAQVGQEEDHDGCGVDGNLAALYQEDRDVRKQVGGEVEEAVESEVVRNVNELEEVEALGQRDPEGVGGNDELGEADKEGGGDTADHAATTMASLTAITNWPLYVE